MKTFVEIGNTMTTQEYLKLKEQEELDKIFEEYDRENNERIMKQRELLNEEQEKQEQEERKIKAITHLADCESEVNELEQLYIKSLMDINGSTDESIKLKAQLKAAKSRFTKASKIVDAIYKEEEINMSELIIDNTTEKICPKCNAKYTEYPALSRRDNKTLICPKCGEREALEDFINWLEKEKSSK